MGRRAKIGAAALMGAVLVIPAALVLAGNIQGVGGDVAAQGVHWTRHSHNAPKNWQGVPEHLEALPDADLANSVTVSTEITRGKVRFRVRSQGKTTPPGAILFAAKGGNSFTFGYDDGCYFHPSNILQWKRAGKAKATVRKISVLTLNGGGPCF